MKLSILSVFGIILICYSLEAKPSSSSDSFLIDIEGLEDKIKNLGDEISKGYSLFISDIESFGKNALDSINSSYDKVKDKVISFYNDARNELLVSALKVENFIEHIPDLTIQEIFKEIKYVLDKANEELGSLMEATDHHFGDAREILNQKVFDVKSQIHEFTERMNDLVDKKKQVKEGREIVESFVKDSTQEVLSCSQQALEPLQATYDDIKERFNEVLQKAHDLVDSLQECLENINVNKETFDCVKSVKDNVLNSFQEMFSTFTGLTATFSSNAVKELFAGGCMLKTRLSVELKKSSVEKKIKNLE